MSVGPIRQKAGESLPELQAGLRLLEGRLSVNTIAERAVRAATLLPGIAGARMWLASDKAAEVWTQAGVLPEWRPESGARAESKGTNDPAAWITALAADDVAAPLLEVRGTQSLDDSLRSQLEVLGRFAALALALAKHRGAAEGLSSIIEATKRLNSTLDLGEVIEVILYIATRQTGAERGTVFLLDRERNEIWSLFGVGLEQQVIRLPAGRGIAGAVARDGTAARLENAYDDPRFEPAVDQKLGFKTHQMLCQPIRNDAGTVIGVLQLLNKPEGFSEEDSGFLDALSAHVAIAIEKAQLHRARIEKEKLERDLALAREIQAGFLPEGPPVFAGVQIAVSHRSSQMVGGDYYDFLVVKRDGEEALLLVVADVEGKGAASALVMANVQAMLHALADHVEPLEKLPATINQKILTAAQPSMAQGRPTKYLSMFLALVEGGGRRVRYVNAGHVPPALIRADGRIEWLETGGAIVGLFPGLEFELGVVDLSPGDLIVACTDGITEAMDAAGTEFGKARLGELAKQSRGDGPEEILRVVLLEVEAHSRGGIHDDDRVLLVIKAA